MEEEKDKIFTLLVSQNIDNHELGLQLAEGLGMDLDSEFWAKIGEVHDYDFGTMPRGWSGSDIPIRLRMAMDKKYLLKYVTADELRMNDKKNQILSDAIGLFKNLKTLVLFCSRNKTLPEAIGKLKNLSFLDLRINDLQYLPKSITELSNLERLHVPQNDLLELPEDIGNLQHLCELLLESNYLKNLPKSLAKLDKLEELDLRNNADMDWAQAFSVIAKMPNLKVLRWGKRRSWYNPNQTECLFLSNQGDTQIKRSLIYKLPEKTYEWKYSIAPPEENDWGQLFEGLSHLKNIKKLYLVNNSLTDLHENIGLMTQLTHLYLSNNKLKTLPDSLRELKNLQSLHLNNNPELEEIPDYLRGVAKRRV